MPLPRRTNLSCLTLLCGAWAGCGLASVPSAGSRGVVPEPAAALERAPAAAAEKPRAREVLLSVSLPRAGRDLAWLSQRLQAPLPAGSLRRFLGVASLRRVLLSLLRAGQLGPFIDLRQPAALALVDLPGPKFRPSEQFVMTVALRDTPAFLEALASRYGQRREEAGIHRFGPLGPAVRVIGARAYIAPSKELLAVAETTLSPLLARGATDAARLVLWSSRIRRRFGGSVDVALRWLRRRRPKGSFLLLEPLRRGAWELIDALWAGRVARLALRFEAQQIALFASIEPKGKAGGTLLPVRAPLWGATLLGEDVSGAFFVAGNSDWAELPLRRGLSLLPGAERARVEGKLRALGARLRGEALAAVYGSKSGAIGLLWAARVDDVAAARRAQRVASSALSGAFVKAWPALRAHYPAVRALRRRPRLSRRLLTFAGGRGALFSTKLAWRARLDPLGKGWRDGWEAWWGGARPEVAHGVFEQGKGGFFMLMVGPEAGAKLAAVARRAKGQGKTGRLAKRWSARVGARSVRATGRVSLTRLIEQLLPIMARRRGARTPWGALIRQILPPVGADRPAALTAWLTPERQRLRLSLELSSDVVGWATKLGLMLFRVGSYGSRGASPRPAIP